MKGIYLACYKAYHPGYNIDYQDINGKRDIGGDMMDVDLSKYDFVIATPPCNYYSRANWRRNESEYSLRTKLLLPKILTKLSTCSIPYIVENVRNDSLFEKMGLFSLPCFVYRIGRHTYWTNILLPSDIQQDFENIQYLGRSKRQGSKNVHRVIDLWLSIVAG